MKSAEQITKDLSYLFSKINWGSSNLDAKAAGIMNTIGTDIKALEGKNPNKITRHKKDKTIVASGPKGIAAALSCRVKCSFVKPSGGGQPDF